MKQHLLIQEELIQVDKIMIHHYELIILLSNQKDLHQLRITSVSFGPVLLLKDYISKMKSGERFSIIS